MSRQPEGVERSAITVVARRVLLDALSVLYDHLDGVTVVGAQAVYLRTQDADLTVAAYTSDADLALTPEQVAHPPDLEQAMKAAGFALTNSDQPGTWSRQEVVGTVAVHVPVDLLVPETFAGRGSRSAELPPHGKITARRVPGLEAVFYDREPMDIPSLEPEVDPRVTTVAVAGVAALLVAKAHKIGDRLADQERRPNRLTNKDAADVLRIFRTADPEEVAERLDQLAAEPAIADVVVSGRTKLVAQFGRVGAPGIRMAENALVGAIERPADLATAWVAAAFSPS